MKYDLFHRAGPDYLFLVTVNEATIEIILAEWYKAHPDEKLLIQPHIRLTLGEGDYGEGIFANDDGMGGLA